MIVLPPGHSILYIPRRNPIHREGDMSIIPKMCKKNSPFLVIFEIFVA
jgi:hypothetical protein